ncbi:MAG: hypothetical protein HY074_14265 [Deltaproteobacteria bacterium]|nr:hypothetical protein [Deltaproteobacteria bacterium]
MNLSADHGARLIEVLAALASGADPAVVSRLGAMAPLVNFELVIAVALKT